MPGEAVSERALDRWEQREPGARRALGRVLEGARTRAGLSREEAADRAGVGRDWYAWLEGGRNIGLSRAALRWVAEALLLTGEERARTTALAGLTRLIGLERVRAEVVPPGVRGLLDGLPTLPAYVSGERGDILAWNEASEALYRCSTIPGPRRNTLLFLFTQPDVRRLVVNWETQVRAALRSHRRALRERPGDEWLAEVEQVLRASSADFQRLWAEPEQVITEPLTKVFAKPSLGRLQFEICELRPSGAPHLLLSIYVPVAAGDTAARLAKLVARHRRAPAAKASALAYRVVRRVKEHLDECATREVPLDELAALAGMDRFRLSRLFSEEVGFPPHAYQLMVRIELAKRALLEGVPAGIVATEVGFADQSHFIRHFRRLEGHTPARFMRAAGKLRLRRRSVD
jgi:AraC-like DNA-binding protein/transcriptional regulator with XRE-family HTH domain